MKLTLNVGTGEEIHQTRKTHTGKDVLRFFKWIDLNTPRDLDIHVVLDNLSAHKAPEVTEWLANPRQKRWHLHFTPTSSSWLNLVEGWFAQLTNKRLKHGSFNSLDALTDAIDVWVSHWNDDPKPFVWTKTANEIIAKVKRGRVALTHQTNPRRTTSDSGGNCLGHPNERQVPSRCKKMLLLTHQGQARNVTRAPMTRRTTALRGQTHLLKL